ncbi:anti sigma factor C-terminal domain-containing protein [Bacillus solitudinis]|uniref:anti sigma factor C-terminal domain-containing protein n=1 Tax=Bacillus solitudinis TaxID=2014074 RepID=UPI000C233B52|nr:anti sigma factor C-terminal domain-containing protein [Bacillus solitudinis]
MMSNRDNNNVKDEKELDDLFDPLKKNRLKKAIKKAKWHSILRNAFISLFILVFLFVGGSIANRSLVYKLEGPTQIAVSAFNEISAPNKYIGKTERYHEILGGKNSFTTYKIIEGKVVYTGESEYNYGLFQEYEGNRIGSESPSIIGTSYDTEDLDRQKYNELGQREMIFFYPFIEYSQYKNDLQLLDQIEATKNMEIALSFDQAYTMDEVRDMLPDEITLSWYWIDDLNEEEKEASKSIIQRDNNGEQKTEEANFSNIRSEKTVYGIKALNASNERLENPLQHFIWALENGREYDTRFKGEFERVYNNLLGQDSKLTKDDIKVFGVVVTGDAEKLKSLQGLPFIKASSIGVITDNL